MSRTTPGPGDSSGYQIRTKGRFTDRWSEWFEGMDLVHDIDGTTVICCPDLDQAALHGVLWRLRDLGLPLISVTSAGSTCAAAAQARTNEGDIQ